MVGQCTVFDKICISYINNQNGKIGWGKNNKLTGKREYRWYLHDKAALGIRIRYTRRQEISIIAPLLARGFLPEQ